jgi:hypothetical protein
VRHVRVGDSVSVASRLTVDCSVRALFIDSSALFFLQLPAVQVEAAGQDRAAGGQPEVRKCVCMCALVTVCLSRRG